MLRTRQPAATSGEWEHGQAQAKPQTAKPKTVQPATYGKPGKRRAGAAAVSLILVGLLLTAAGVNNVAVSVLHVQLIAPGAGPAAARRAPRSMPQDGPLPRLFRLIRKRRAS